jgi:hypothetical protein
MTSSDGNHGPSHAAADGHEEADHGPPPLPEPHTPMWLPAVGAVLFLTVGLIWALSTPPKDPTETMGTPTGTVVSAAAPTPTPPPAPPPQRGGGAPGGHGGH